jgi:hypothetical protein
MFISDSDRYLSAPLTGVAVEANLINAPNRASGRIFPIIPVRVQSTKYWTYPIGSWMRSAAQKLERGSESAGTDFKVQSQDPYFCDIYALHTDIWDIDRANVQNQFDIDKGATVFLQDQIALKREADFLSAAFTTGKWSTDVTPTVKWGDPAATPIKDIRTQMRVVKKKSGGRRPNKAVIQEEVWDVLQDSPDVLARVVGGAKTADPARATKEDFARILELDEVIVVSEITNTGNENGADNFTFLPGQNVLLTYAPNNPTVMQPSGGFTFVWTDLPGVGPQGERVRKIRMEPRMSDRIQAEGNWDTKLIAPDLGVLLYNVLA